MQELKRKIKKPTNILQQIHNRINDKWLLDSENNSKICSAFVVDSSSKNSFVLINSTPFRIISSYSKNSEQILVCRRYLNPQSFFFRPMDSLKTLGIMCVEFLSAEREIFKVDDINFKYFAIPYKTKFVYLFCI